MRVAVRLVARATRVLMKTVRTVAGQVARVVVEKAVKMAPREVARVAVRTVVRTTVRAGARAMARVVMAAATREARVAGWEFRPLGPAI